MTGSGEAARQPDLDRDGGVTGETTAAHTALQRPLIKPEIEDLHPVGELPPRFALDSHLHRPRQFLSYVHSFRGLAILAVVATHTSDLLAWGPGSPLAYRLLYSAVQNGTVPFVLIAGFLFQHLSAGFRYTSYLRRKVTNVILPYLIVSLPVLGWQFARRSGVFAAVAPGND